MQGEVLPAALEARLEAVERAAPDSDDLAGSDYVALTLAGLALPALLMIVAWVI